MISHVTMTILICVVSVAVLFEFLVFYTRFLFSTARKVALSEQVLRVAGIEDGELRGDEFPDLLKLLHICPRPGNERAGILAVRAYFRLLQPVYRCSVHVWPGLSARVEKERRQCARFVAILLDRRINFTREMIAQQAATRF
jgi:hypothetical protein